MTKYTNVFEIKEKIAVAPKWCDCLSTGLVILSRILGDVIAIHYWESKRAKLALLYLGRAFSTHHHSD